MNKPPKFLKISMKTKHVTTQETERVILKKKMESFLNTCNKQFMRYNCNAVAGYGCFVCSILFEAFKKNKIVKKPKKLGKQGAAYAKNFICANSILTIHMHQTSKIENRKVDQKTANITNNNKVFNRLFFCCVKPSQNLSKAEND